MQWFTSLHGKPIFRREKGAGFIVIEGLDGSGQSTQIVLLKEFLLRKGLQVLAVKEPTLDSEAGKRIRKILDKEETTSPQELQKLFAQDRAEHLQQVIIPNLEQRIWVLSDRYFFTSFAYGAAKGVDLEQLIEMNNEFLLPDIALFLDVSPAVCVQRIQSRGEKIHHFEQLEHFEKARKMFHSLVQRFENIYAIDGEQSRENVAKDIQESVTRAMFSSTD